MILVHGGLATAEISWNEAYVSRLAERFRVVMPDSRGHGRTRNPTPTLSYSQMADDVVAFSAALGLTTPVIVGYSDGGQIGIELGLRHPGFARAIVLGGTVIGPSPGYFELLASMGFTVAGECDVERMRDAFGDSFKTMVEGHHDWRSFLNQISTLWMNLPTYSAELLSTIATPCLVICGDRDTPSLDAALPLSRALQRSELAVVPNSEHGAASKPMFWSNVLDFLDRH